jgi:hypothetical protein
MKTAQVVIPVLIVAVIAVIGQLYTTFSSSITDLETPWGGEEGSMIAPMNVLGVINLTTSTGNRDADNGEFIEHLMVEVPVGTDVIVPCIRGWWIGYGRAVQDNIDELSNFTWDPDDHYWGLGTFSIEVVDINAPNTSVEPPTQSAQIGVKAFLGDHNHDDPWFGLVQYSLMCLEKV